MRYRRACIYDAQVDEYQTYTTAAFADVDADAEDIQDYVHGLLIWDIEEDVLMLYPWDKVVWAEAEEGSA